MIDVMSELKGPGEMFQRGDFRGGLELIHRLWARMPSPKTISPNAYMVVEYGVALALKAGDHREAQIWAALAPQFSVVREDTGEIEFLVGKVAFECGDLVQAKDQFNVAHRKSRGRAFKAEDPKYLSLLQKK
jgi:hypothetical protein